MIQTNGLRKEIRTGSISYTVLNDINLSVNKGEFVSFYGPSGSGKTSLVNILGMLDIQTSGEYLFNGISIKDLSVKQRLEMRRDVISFVLSDAKLIEELNVYENIELPLIYQNLPKQKRNERVMKALGDINLLHKSKSKISDLSLVQKQKVSIARALIVNPQLIIADEPTGHLNSADGSEILGMLNDINEIGIAIALFTHSSVIAGRGHRVIQMFDGHLVAEKTVK